MNFKKISSVLLCLGFLQSSFISNVQAASYQRYYDVVQDSIKASTVEEAVMILALYSSDASASEIRSQLQMQLQLWTADNGSCDWVVLKYSTSQAVKFLCIAFSIGTFSLPVLSKCGYHVFPGSMAWAAVCGTMSAGIALLLAKNGELMKNDIKRFERICRLMNHTAK